MADDILEGVLQRLRADVPTLSEEVADLVHREQESYRQVSDEALGLAVRRNMATAIGALRTGRASPVDDLGDVVQTIHERFLGGIPMEEAVRAFAICIWQIHQRFLEIGTDAGLALRLMLEGSDTLWRLGDAITTRVVTVYHELSLQQSLLDAQRRASFVGRLLRGMATTADLREHSLGPEAGYAAVRCVGPGGVGLSEMSALEASGSTLKAGAVLALVDGECIGVVAKAPRPPARMVVAVGPVVPLSEIGRSWEIADRICHVALHLGLTGVQGLAELGWRVAAVDQPELLALLRVRFLEPLRAEGAFGAEIESSVRCYLREGMSIPRAAASLNLHVNTVRYRLRRFSELTNTSLEDPGDLMDVVWALELGELPARPPRL
jgi:putative transposase